MHMLQLGSGRGSRRWRCGVQLVPPACSLVAVVLLLALLAGPPSSCGKLFDRGDDPGSTPDSDHNNNNNNNNQHQHQHRRRFASSSHGNEDSDSSELGADSADAAAGHAGDTGGADRMRMVLGGGGGGGGGGARVTAQPDGTIIYDSSLAGDAGAGAAYHGNDDDAIEHEEEGQFAEGDLEADDEVVQITGFSISPLQLDVSQANTITVDGERWGGERAWSCCFAATYLSAWGLSRLQFGLSCRTA